MGYIRHNRRRVAVAVMMVVTATGVMPQTPVPQPVIIVENTSYTNIKTISNWVDQLVKMEKAVKAAQDTLESAKNQYQALKAFGVALSESDWAALVRATTYQAQAFGYFSNTAAKLPEAFVSLQTNEEYRTFASASRDLAQSAYEADNLMRATDTLLQNTGRRMEMWGRLQESSQDSDSLIAQLQIMNNGLALLGGQIGDLQGQAYAADSFAATLEKQRLIEEELHAKQEYEWAITWGEAGGSRYTEEEFRKRVLTLGRPPKGGWWDAWSMDRWRRKD